MNLPVRYHMETVIAALVFWQVWQITEHEFRCQKTGCI
jgi:hypothetical protein